MSELNYDNSAEKVTLVHWRCKKCRKYWASENGARGCCTGEWKCEVCGAMYKRDRWCERCYQDRRTKRYEAMDREEWDGHRPLAVFGGDLYFFDGDDARDYLHEHPEARIVICLPIPKDTFDLIEFLDDAVPEGYKLDSAGKAAEKSVNDWILTCNTCWSPGNTVPSDESLIRHGVKPSQEKTQ